MRRPKKLLNLKACKLLRDLDGKDHLYSNYIRDVDYWLRKIHNVHCVIIPDSYGVYGYITFICTPTEHIEIDEVRETFISYEEALEDSISGAIKYLYYKNHDK